MKKKVLQSDLKNDKLGHFLRQIDWTLIHSAIMSQQSSYDLSVLRSIEQDQAYLLGRGG